MSIYVFQRLIIIFIRGQLRKYNNYIDDDFVQNLKEDDDFNNNKLLIKRPEDFQKYTYNTIKKTLYNEGKKLKKLLNKN